MRATRAKIIYMMVMVSVVFLQVGGAWGIIVDRVVAKVNDDIITLSEVQEKGLPLLSRIRSRRDGGSREVQKAEKEILKQLIDIELQLQEARELGMTVSQAEIEKTLTDIREKNNITQEALERMFEEQGTDIESYKAEIKDRLLLQKIYYFRVIASAKVSQQQIESYYKEHIPEYTGPEKVKVRQIFFAVEPANPAKREDVVRARALEVMERIRAGEDFASLARAYSEGPNTARGGELGFFKRGEALPILEQAMFHLNSGMVSELIRSKAGFHILKVDEHVYPKPLPLKGVAKEITDIIKKERAQENYERWIKKLRGEAFIEITYDLSENRR